MTRDIVLRGIKSEAEAGFAWIAATNREKFKAGVHIESVWDPRTLGGWREYRVTSTKTRIIVEPAP